MRTEGETAMVNDHTPPILQLDKLADREALRRSGLGTPGPKIADGADADHPIRPRGPGQVAAVWILRGMIRTLWVRTPTPMVAHRQPPTHLTSSSERSPVSLVTLNRATFYCTWLTATAQGRITAGCKQGFRSP